MSRENKRSRWDWLGRIPPPERPVEPKGADPTLDITTLSKIEKDFVSLNEAYNSISEGRFDETIEICNTILQKNSSNFEAWYFKGKGYVSLACQSHQSGNYGEYIKYCELAGQCFKQALHINPNHREVLLLQGWILIDLERFTEAFELIERFLKINPKDIEMLYLKSTALYHLKRYKEALTSLNEILALDPYFEEAKDLKQLCLMRIK